MSVRQRKRIGASIEAKRLLEASLQGKGQFQVLLDAEQEQELMSDIHKNRSASFGLVKLARYNLNCPLSPPTGDATFIALSSRLQRDHITSSLLRAGADPSVLDGTQSPDYALLGSLWRLPPAYAVWLINLHTRLVSSASSSSSSASAPARCCGASHTPANPVLVAPSCGCSICSRCFWAATRRASPVRECRCPACSKAFDAGSEVRCSGTVSFPWAEEESEEGAGEGPQLSLDELAGEIERLFSADAHDESRVLAAAAAAWSHRRWLALPIDRPAPSPHSSSSTSTTATTVTAAAAKSNAFSAETLRTLHSRSLGRTQAQRSERLFDAAMHGNTCRVAFLVAAGASLEERNEYGHTAYFVAAWRGHEGTARALRVLGAAEVADCLGAMPQSVPLLLPPGTGARDEASEEGLPWGCNPSPPILTTIRSPSLPGSASGLASGAGAGEQPPLAYYIDGGFTDELLAFLSSLPATGKIPLTPAEKPACSDRYYWADTRGVLLRAVERVLSRVRDVEPGAGLGVVGIFPHLRFLEYRNAGGALPPHIDLCRTEHYYRSRADDCDEAVCTSLTSTHTFLLYLSDCAHGGETALLHRLGPPLSPGDDGTDNIIAAVKPRRGRLFFFPHACPHEGRRVECVPKLLIRGEMI